MKIKIKGYILYLLKTNIFYIIGFFILIFLLFFVVLTGTKRIIESEQKIKKLNSDIYDLKTKIFLINSNYDEEKIKESLEILNNLIPNNEDYFSIIYSLGRLTNQTGLIINDYYINIDPSLKNKISLTVSGFADSNSFLEFLKNYNFAGGRLITSESINHSIEKDGNFQLTLNFYNKPAFDNSSSLDRLDYFKNTEEVFKEIEKIKKKINLNFSEIENFKKNYDYSKKENPFE